MGQIIRIKQYEPEDAGIWDSFVDSSKNGTFLLKRGYMDYHSHRFNDRSLMFFNNKGKLMAVLPANVAAEDDGSLSLHSHQGLTYGGFVLGGNATVNDVADMFRLTARHLLENNIRTFYYKQMPSCYHLYPSEEDEYVLWSMGAELYVCNISSDIELNSPYFTVPFERRRRRGVARAVNAGYTIVETKTIEPFWQIMENNLREKYNVAPVHSVEEMRLLMQRFPDEIKFYAAVKNGTIEAGAVMYLTRQTAHVQYAHASPAGKADGAIDLLYDTLMKHFANQQYRHFDIGISNENGGHVLNSKLIAQKEGFGGRGITYKQWKYLI